MNKNKILVALPDSDLAVVRSQCTRIDLGQGQTVVRSGHLVDNVYFPETCVLACIMEYSDGRCIDLAAIGSEGSSGVLPYLGARRGHCRIAARIGGAATALSLRSFFDLVERLPAFADAMRQYSLTYIVDLQMTAACNSLHHVEHRLARYLLSLADRAETTELPLTQDTLADILGVHRPTISTAMKSLQSAGLIDNQRGRVHIRDRERLKTISCECYELGQSVEPY